MSQAIRASAITASVLVAALCVALQLSSDRLRRASWRVVPEDVVRTQLGSTARWERVNCPDAEWSECVVGPAHLTLHTERTEVPTDRPIPAWEIVLDERDVKRWVVTSPPEAAGRVCSRMDPHRDTYRRRTDYSGIERLSVLRAANGSFVLGCVPTGTSRPRWTVAFEMNRSWFFTATGRREIPIAPRVPLRRWAEEFVLAGLALGWTLMRLASRWRAGSWRRGHVERDGTLRLDAPDDNREVLHPRPLPPGRVLVQLNPDASVPHFRSAAQLTATRVVRSTRASLTRSRAWVANVVSLAVVAYSVTATAVLAPAAAAVLQSSSTHSILLASDTPTATSGDHQPYEMLGERCRTPRECGPRETCIFEVAGCGAEVTGVCSADGCVSETRTWRACDGQVVTNCGFAPDVPWSEAVR